MIDIKYFLAGVTLAGWRQPDGRITTNLSAAKLGSFPAEITVEGCMFTLETVTDVGSANDPRGMFVNAEYV